MPLNYILRKCTGGFKHTKSQGKINHLMYIDDIKLFAKILYKNIQSGHRDGIWHRKMCFAQKEKRETVHDERNGATRPRKKL